MHTPDFVLNRKSDSTSPTSRSLATANPSHEALRTVATSPLRLSPAHDLAAVISDLMRATLFSASQAVRATCHGSPLGTCSSGVVRRVAIGDLERARRRICAAMGCASAAYSLRQQEQQRIAKRSRHEGDALSSSSYWYRKCLDARVATIGGGCDAVAEPRERFHRLSACSRVGYVRRKGGCERASIASIVCDDLRT